MPRVVGAYGVGLGAVGGRGGTGRWARVGMHSDSSLVQERVKVWGTGTTGTGAGSSRTGGRLLLRRDQANAHGSHHAKVEEGGEELSSLGGGR